MSQEIKRVTNLAWRRFLASEAGGEGMLYLREKVPNVVKGESSAIIFDAGRAQGWKDCLDAISEIISSDEPKSEQLENL